MFFVDCDLKLRQVAAANEPLFVDAENLVSVSLAIDMILDFAIVVFHIQSLHELIVAMNAPNAVSALGPRGN